MCELLSSGVAVQASLASIGESLTSAWYILLVLLGFSVVVFFHELGHFVVAKWSDVRVERFAVGFGPELFGFTSGETRYSFNIFPLGGFVKMLGQEDFEVDKTGALLASDDPRSFSNKPVSHRMAIVSAGVLMNLVVAALIFMIVYMWGREERVPVVGYLKPDSPASHAGIQVGDRIVSINDASINNFSQIFMAVRLADPFEDLRFVVERDGQMIPKMIRPKESEIESALQVGIGWPGTNQIEHVSQEYLKGEGPYPRRGDMITEVNGVSVEEADGLTTNDLILQGRNIPSTVVVRRVEESDPDGPGQRLSFKVNKIVNFTLHGISTSDPRDLLGLCPRLRITGVYPKTPADYAGFMEGDVVASWGSRANPSADYVRDSLIEHAGRDIPVRVVRNGKVQSKLLFYRPEKAFDREGKPKIKPGFKLTSIEQNRVIVAEVVEDENSPAFKAAMPVGCEIVRLNGQPVLGWADLAEKFRLNAGNEVDLSYKPDIQESEVKTTQFRIPNCISAMLDLPSWSLSDQTTQSIHFLLDGKGDVPIELNGNSIDAPAFFWISIREYLRQRIGQTVEVTYKKDDGKVVTKSLEVAEEMIDPWYRRVEYQVHPIITKPATYFNRKSNPLEAVWAGTVQTYYSVAKAYLTFRRLIFTRSVSVENISGPIGIVHVGTRLAKYSKIEMLFFLAFLSANLAVINFLPLPIVDGGLMVFLIIEKIKGSPVSLKTQIVTQMIGIVLLAFTFLWVTLNDITKIWG